MAETARLKLRKALHRWREAGMLRSISTLTMGAVSARLLGIAFLPWLTRIYAPDDFGILSVFMAMVAMLTPLLMLRYEVAIPLPRHEGAALNLLFFCFGLLVCMSMLIGVALWFSAASILRFFSVEKIVAWWWLIMPALFLSGVYSLFGMWATRRRAYLTMAKADVLQTLLGSMMKIVLSFLFVNPLGLLMGQMFSWVGGSFVLVRAALREGRRTIGRINLRRALLLAGRYREFPRYRLPSQLLLVFSQQAPLLFSAAMFGPATAGFIGLALGAVAVPMSLIGQAAGKVFYAEAASLTVKNAGRIYELSLQLQKRLIVGGLLPSVLFMIAAPDLFAWLFGAVWKTAGVYTSYLSVFMLLQLTSAPLMQALNLFEGQRIFLILNMTRFLSLVGLLMFCLEMNVSADVFVKLYGFLMAFLYMVVSVFMIWFLKRKAVS